MSHTYFPRVAAVAGLVFFLACASFVCLEDVDFQLCTF